MPVSVDSVVVACFSTVAGGRAGLDAADVDVMFKQVPAQFDFPGSEREVLAFWEANGVYEKSLARREGAPPFVFYEGPPTANGLPHPGHCLTRIIKDIFPRYRTMRGYYCHRKGGWDTHGLPVEAEVCKELGIHTKSDIENHGVERFIRLCRESVFRYTREWEELTRRLGFWINLDEAYVTYHQSYVESVWWALATLFRRGLLYQGHKIVWWWPQGGTALSAGEVGQGYREVDDPSVTVRFRLLSSDAPAEDEKHSSGMVGSSGIDSKGGTGVSPGGTGISPGGTGISPGGTGVSPVSSEEPTSQGDKGVSPVAGSGPKLSKRRRHLPHWEAGGSTYFITFRTRQGDLSDHEKSLVKQACLHFDGIRADIHALVVMPDHVHLLLTPLPHGPENWWSLPELMHSIKSYTSKEISRRRGQSGPVWLEEYFDRIIRNDEDYEEKLNYILGNPLKRGLGEDYSWLWMQSFGAADGRDARPTHSEADALQQDCSPLGVHGCGTDGRDARPTHPEADALQEDCPSLGVHGCGTDGRDARPTHPTSTHPTSNPPTSNPPVFLLAWTTTPWTLLSNVALAVHSDVEYVELEIEGEHLILAAERMPETFKGLPVDLEKDVRVVRKIKGADLVGLKYEPLFCYAEPQGGRAWEVIDADFVTLETGTGIVHIAPAFGEDDYRVAQEKGLGIIQLIAPDGMFVPEATDFAGRFCKEADSDIIRNLKDRGLLLKRETYRHDYPFCWRAEDDPLIQYARKSWFVRTTAFKDDFLANNARINWLPEHIRDGRFGNFLADNVDWALSRERFWGTPLPIWECERTGKQEAIASYAELLAKPGVQGIEVWDEAKRNDPDLIDDLKVHKPYIDAITYDSPFAAGARMRRVPEVIDCWFDSGCMPFAQWGYPHAPGSREVFESRFPADFIS